jgi:molecular chaperone GrpE (heat shock protein)
MTELKRTEDKLTTAEIAARSTSPAAGSQVDGGIVREDGKTSTPARPTVVRNEKANRGNGNESPTTENRRDSENAPATTNRRDWDNTPATTADQHLRDTGAGTALFSDSDIGDLRSRWSNVQAEFVDEPRHAVQEADQLVAAVMQRLAEGFAKERDSLEKQWESGENASTEDLRMALQRYRAFFNRLLNAA